MRSVVFAISALLLLVGLRAGGHDARAEDVRVTEGRELYRRYCASCHGVEGKGDGPVAGAVVPPPTDLTTLSERWGSPLAKGTVAEFIDGRRDVRAHGPANMPVWGTRLTDPAPPSTGGDSASENIASVVAYLETLQRKRP